MIKKKITKENIKDWLIIQRIRLLNYVKEYKYLSAGIGVFLLSCIVYLVAFASDDNVKLSSTINVTPKTLSSADEISEIKSFSTIVYDIDYRLDALESSTQVLVSDEVIIEATFNENVDAEWLIYSDESSDYNVSDDGKTLTVTLHSVNVGINNEKQIYLRVNNVKGDGDDTTPEITTTVKVKEANSEFSNEEIKLSVSNTKEATLSYELVGGTAYNDDLCKDGRCAPFGIVVGIEEDSLEGVYFNPNLEMDLSVLDSTNANLELLLDENKYGIYDSKELYIIKDMPNKAYNSGSVTLNKSEVIDQNNTAQEISLVGNSTISLKIDEEYEELGIILNSDEEAFCFETTNDCERKINGTDEDIIDTSEEGEHTITYKYLSVTLTRKVIVEGEKETITDSVGNVYSVSGNEVVTLLKDDEFFDDGIMGMEYREVITNDDTNETIEKIDTSKVGNYTISYTDLITEEGEELEGELSRKVNIVLDYGKSQTTQIGGGNPSESLGDNYKLSIQGIKSDGTINKFKNKIVLGTYYVTANSVRPEGNTGNIVVTLASAGKTATVENKLYSAGTKNSKISFNLDENGDLEELSDNAVLSYGEEVILKSEFEYLKDGDDTISNYVNTIDFSNSKFEIIDYSSETFIHILINDQEAIYNTTDKSLKYFDGSNALNDIDSFELTINKDENSKLSSIVYSVGRVNQGTKIDFRVRLKTLKENVSGKEIFIDSKYSYIQNGNKEESKNTKILITAFKARTSLLVNDNDYDIIINGAAREEQISTWKVYPEITSYAENNEAIKSIEIEVILPKGINYIYDENYEIPENYGKEDFIQDGVTHLKYTINNTKINDWVDPIVFETNYDVDIMSNTDLEVKAIISATTVSNITDMSDIEEYRTTRRIVTYQNNEKIATSLYTSHIAIPKETEFDVNVKIFKNTSDNFNNLDIVTILPYNDGTEKNNFSGEYSLSELSEGLLCTTEEVVTKTNITTINWEDCSVFEEDGYIDVTAVKKSNIVLNESKKTDVVKFNIVPSENSTDDIYTLNSYVINNNEILEIPELTVTVISKKITGIVWEDFNANGLIDEDEKRIPDVMFILFDANTDEEISTAFSDENGEYKLTDIEPGDYYIVAEYNTSKYGLTLPNAGFDKSLISVFNAHELTSEAEENLFSTYIVRNSLEEEDEDPEEDEGDIDIDEDLEEDEGDIDDDEDLEGDEGDIDDDEDLEEDEGDIDIDEDLEEDEGDIDDDEDSEEDIPKLIIKSEIITVTENTKIINNINLGLTLKKVYTVKMDKFITKAVVTNNLGVSTIKDYGKATLAKLDVKDINNLSIKVIYTIELENIGYYPGYVYNVKDYIPDGMSFNKDYEENKGWLINEDGYLENNSLFDELLNSGDKKYLTLALDISRKEAGSFINYAVIDDEDLQMLIVDQELGDVGD